MSTLGTIREGAYSTYEKAACIGGPVLSPKGNTFNSRHQSEMRGDMRRLPNKLPVLEAVREVSSPLFMNQ